MEHLTFKGTQAFSSTRALSEAVEGIGGTFNASTDRESTVYYVRCGPHATLRWRSSRLVPAPLYRSRRAGA